MPREEPLGAPTAAPEAPVVEAPVVEAAGPEPVVEEMAPRAPWPALDLETAGPATLVRIGLARERFPNLSAAAAWDLMMELETSPVKTVWRDGGAYTLDNANLPVFIPGLTPDPAPPAPAPPPVIG